MYAAFFLSSFEKISAPKRLDFNTPTASSTTATKMDDRAAGFIAATYHADGFEEGVIDHHCLLRYVSRSRSAHTAIANLSDKYNVAQIFGESETDLGVHGHSIKSCVWRMISLQKDDATMPNKNFSRVLLTFSMFLFLWLACSRAFAIFRGEPDAGAHPFA